MQSMQSMQSMQQRMTEARGLGRQPFLDVQANGLGSDN